MCEFPRLRLWYKKFEFIGSYRFRNEFVLKKLKKSIRK
ncbi:hypothetical protein LEP1GSC008_0982 [Leptospira kirschneri serovar Bulgarica str. Nikolaevo]|uniref:Uncharacterized protein n=1 Tax=Leptospira kirschneri serovar Bulgarica str. Nikolaevo TaxID=1240687 RepID=M6FCL3_9LEPT|nr:hypothetical protein LEP1GSC008_0982 [Leptospira kirschneri serovar Bulgarica str. Nikolaevo]